MQCVCVCVGWGTYGTSVVRDYSDSLRLPLCGVWTLNSSHQACLQAPVLTAPSWQPTFLVSLWMLVLCVSLQAAEESCTVERLSSFPR